MTGACLFFCETAVEQYLKSPADCENAAVYYKSCTCGEANEETFVYGDALGHDEITNNAKAATCTETDWDAYVTCSRCDYTTYSVIESIEHDLDSEYCCKNCDYEYYTEGLLFTLSSDESYYSVSKGTANSSLIVIPSKYK